MRATHLAILPTVLAVFACTVACGDGEKSGQASPAPTTANSATGNPEAGAPPTVPNPLPASLIKADPCKVLTPEQAKTLFSGVEPETDPAQDTGAAMACHWSNVDRGSTIGIQLVYAWENGLDTVYKKRVEAGLFEELEPVQGYPVVAYGPTDDRPTGRCNLAIGIADNAAFEADVKLADSKVGKADPCAAARDIADLAITTLKGMA